MEVNVIIVEFLGFPPPTPQHTHANTYFISTPPTISTPSPTLWPSCGRAGKVFDPLGFSPSCQGNSPIPQSGCSH